MRTHAQLCHVSAERCIVLVEALEGTQPLGSALGEGHTVSEAEDQALDRLRARLRSSEITESENLQNTAGAPSHQTSAQPLVSKQPQPIKRVAQPSQTEATREPKQVSEPLQQQPTPADPSAVPSNTSGSEASGNVERQPDPQPPSEAPVDPEDWSEELTAIDLELQRVGWDRDSEKIYLERAFGHASRHRLTRFSDLVAYLKRLRNLDAGSDPQHAEIPLRRSDLVSQGDEILQRLQWNQQQAKDFLNKHLQVSSRQQLTDEQLLSFNMMLEEQLIS